MKKIIVLVAAFSVSFCAVQSVNAQSTVTPLTVNQWVQPNEDGVLTGKIFVPAENGTTAAVENAEVAIRSNDGKLYRAEGKTNAKGEFSIPGVEPGVYSLTARADYIFAVCAMHVLDSDLVGETEFPHTAEVAAANVDFTTVKTAIIRYMPPTKKTDASIKGAKLSALASRVCGQDTFRVNQFRGGMKGRLLKAGTIGDDLDNVQLTNVFILKDGIEVARTITNEAGEFEIASIGAGNYSLMAVGADGLGLVGFELVKETTTAMTTTDGKTFVQAPCCCNEFSMQVAPVQNVGTIISDTVISEQPIMQGGIVDGGIISDGGIIADGGGMVGGGGISSGGGGFASGGGGGGGLLGGGGGGLGGIAALAGIGGIIAVATSDDDSTITPAPVASPVVPN
ncbi:MAG: carboxypeptidase-like regulatory domain-containing protein [Pirellulaceae bacterium]